MNKELRILFLEDSEDDVLLIQRELSKAGFVFTPLVVDSRDEFEEALRFFHPDVILSDHSLPEFNSVEALKIYQKEKTKSQLYVPFILITGSVSEEFAVQCIKDGASDYILKDRLRRLPSAIDSALERLRVEQEKRKSEEELNNFFRLSPDILCRWGTDGYFKKVNPAVTTILGFPEEEVLNRHLLEFVHPDDREMTAQELSRFLHTNTSLYFEVRVISRNGETKWLAWSSSTIMNDSTFYAVGKDITEKKRAEQDLQLLNEELVNARIKKQQEITEAVLAAQEAERQDIGRELHDNINQILASSRLYISMSKSQQENKDALVAKADELIDLAIGEIRNLSHSLTVPSLLEKNFCNVVNGLALDVQEAGGFQVHCDLQLNDEASISDQLKLNLYRIIQEQLHNIIKHAKASNVDISLTQEGQKIFLKIADDGVGFDTTKETGGIGFFNMQTRAAVFNGEVKISSSPGQGCVLEVNLILVNS